MVWVKNVGMKPAYVCDSCGHGYREARTAFECEDYCTANNSISPPIAKKAVFRQ